MTTSAIVDSSSQIWSKFMASPWSWLILVVLAGVFGVVLAWLDSGEEPAPLGKPRTEEPGVDGLVDGDPVVARLAERAEVTWIQTGTTRPQRDDVVH